jgi:hypothetical protein
MKSNVMLMFILVCVVACAPKNNNILWGTYALKTTDSRGVLILNRDGTFQQKIFENKTSAKFSGSGTWSYNKDIQSIVFDGLFIDFMCLATKSYKNTINLNPGLTILPVSVVLGQVSLSIDEDISIYYIKVSMNENFDSCNK